VFRFCIDLRASRILRQGECEDVSTIVLLDQLQAETCGGRGQRVRRVNTRVQGLEWVSVWLMRGPSVYVCSELYKRYSLSCRRGMKLLNIEYHLSEQLFPQLSSVSLPTFSSFHSLAVANTKTTNCSLHLVRLYIWLHAGDGDGWLRRREDVMWSWLRRPVRTRI
jgi:hypothetical protein